MFGVGYSTAHPWYRALMAARCLVVVGSLAFCVNGCSPREPVVANPIDPWEEQVEREQLAQREQEEKQRAGRATPPAGGGYGAEKEEAEHSPLVTALADIVAFPIRGAAWLVHTLL